MLEELFLLILVVHFLADFALQTHWQASNKSSDDNALTYHVLTYSLVWFAVSYVFLGSLGGAILFFIITFLAHYTTDYFTSRLVKKFFDKEDFHNGFVAIGFDQVLHYVQLYLTFKILL